MPTNREIYFNLLNSNNKYLTRLVIKSLLNDANGFVDEVSLYKAFDLPCQNYQRLENNIERVKSGEPFQYVLGYSNFIDQYFEVNPHVLIPRQETEELVISARLLIQKIFTDTSNLRIADICTGSGCIAVTLKRYFPSASIFATDIDEECLKVAKRNADQLDITFFRGNLLDPLIKEGLKFDVIISNPPYIQNFEEIDEQVWKFEPHLALLAKPSTYFYEKMISQCDEILNKQGVMIFEIGEDMEKPLTEIIDKYLPNAIVKFSKDMHNKMRFLYIIKKGDNNYA
ncbi:MAG TPA: peptide chain release factor N(5)-glutamine methyltransferase [Bacilli bacterium]|nr:peptide chain release factor N(5)-glutamine methyltransferase [Bacilli bacterium]HPS18563.1 peptide chain release factor N(5)-glutamine methyltransferase [Bacilli bacterium]